jgi:hypothetical protein
MAGSSIRSAIVFGMKNFDHHTHLKAVLNQGCKVVLFVSNANESAQAREVFSSFSLSRLDESQTGATSHESVVDSSVIE